MNKDDGRGEVKLAGNLNHVEREAILLGSLAVHRSVNPGPPWTITHRATGCAIGYAQDEAFAVDAAKDIERLHPEAMARLNKLKFGQFAPWKRRPAEIAALVRTLQAKGLRA